ncbi:hypothetical protein DRF59_09100 [Chryseobacterium flavum]|uniref:Uncharacterized protein n=1 Tax=Chryseobacterium flavum TaxID=415851 RepID=A0A3D9CMZ3_9FLAO|nr:DUF6493 family protein [Chryseobacterium flavum]REC67100.1 hypothetical protein DRF59_09100 [Chryseobacterium flavum]
MLIEEEFKAIYLNYKIKEIISFLKKLTPKDKKEIAVLLKKHINKEWGHNSISVLAALVCCKTKNEYEKVSPGYYSWPVPLIDELFEFYVPEWISESHSFLEEINYLKVLEWEQKGYFTLNEGMRALLLSSSLISKGSFDEIISKYPVTLHSHIWLLFEHESNIMVQYDEERSWKKIIKKLVQENRIDRFRVLKSSIRAISFNFSKEQNTWFLDLFSCLEPKENEILALQEELFLVFQSVQHSLFPGILKVLNQVVEEKEFKTELFLHAVEPLLTLSAKNVLNGLLLILEKIIKSNKQYSEEVCILLMPVFLNKDKTIQTKGAKIIGKYGDPQSSGITKELQSYKSSLLADAHSLLDRFLTEEVRNHEEFGYEALSWHIPEPIASVATVEDFIFLASQVFNSYETHSADQFLDALMRLNNELEEEHFDQLEPAFKAAFKLKGTGGLKHLLATFFINYGLLKQKTPSSVLLQARLEFPRLENWGEKRTPFIFKAYQKLLLAVFDKLKQGKNLPLLSVPDQTPCWISADRLIDKLRAYQDEKEQPVLFDLQAALLRVKKDNLADAEQYAEKQLDVQYRSFLKPLFDQNYFRDHYDHTYLDGNFEWKPGSRKIYKWNNTEEIPQLLIMIENQKELPENAAFLDYLFNSYHDIYQDDLNYILYSAPYFSGSVFAKKYNETLSNQVYQYDIKGNIAFLNAWMKLNLPFQPVHYLFLTAGLLNKDRAFSDIAFEVLINRMLSDDFNIRLLGKLLGENISFQMSSVKRLTDGLSGYINLTATHNQGFEKMLTTILTGIGKPVFNLKKILELYYELLNLNHSEMDEAIADQLNEWEKENNLKKIIHQIKTHERKTI